MAHRGAQVRYAWDPLPPKSAVLASRRASVRTNASASSADPYGEDDSGGGFPWLGMLVLAAACAAAVGFAYADLAPIVGAVNADNLLPAQDAVRAAVVTAKTGAVRACDLTVEMALDAYEAADAGVKKIGEIATGAASGASSAASGTAASPIAGSPLADVVAKTKEGVGYFTAAIANGEWAKILMAKPFKSLAAITLTVVRIAVSWFLSGVEFACAMLYSTPAYAAVVAGFGLMVVNSLVKAITGPKRELAKVGATVTTPAPERVAPVQTTAAGVVKAEPKKEEPVAEEKKVVEKEEKPKMPATAVFEASSRVMSDKEKEVMMNRVQEAKRQLGMQDDGYSSPSVRDPFQPVSSYRPAASYSSSATGSSPSSDQSDVDRIFAELTSKYGLQSSGSAPTRPSAVPNSYNPPAMPSYGSSYLDSTAPPAAAAKGYALPATDYGDTSFDADAFLAAFSTDTSYTPPARDLTQEYSKYTSPMPSVDYSAYTPSVKETPPPVASTPAPPTPPPVPKAAPKPVEAAKPAPKPVEAAKPAPKPVEAAKPAPKPVEAAKPAPAAPVSAASSTKPPRDRLDLSKVGSKTFKNVDLGGILGGAAKVVSEGAKLGQQAIEAASKEAGKGGVGGVSSSTPRETAKPPASGSAANEQILSEMLEEGTVIKRKKPKDESK
jgi:outer membrane biosynthesis protein TonB